MTRTSFFLTKELEDQLVSLSWKNTDGTIQKWDDRFPLIEFDPEKRQSNGCYPQRFLLTSILVQVHLGGVGCYAPQRDYLKLLRHILQINGMHHISWN